jgi:hypothetical protein
MFTHSPSPRLFRPIFASMPASVIVTSQRPSGSTTVQSTTDFAQVGMPVPVLREQRVPAAPLRQDADGGALGPRRPGQQLRAPVHRHQERLVHAGPARDRGDLLVRVRMLAMKALADSLAEAPHCGGVGSAGLAEEALVGGHGPVHGVAQRLSEAEPALAWGALPGEVLQHQYGEC